MFYSKMFAIFLVVGIVSSVTVGLATNLISVPEHDELGYVANALYYSGVNTNTNQLFFNGEQYHPYYSERPPLFWWLLTSLFSIGMNPIVSITVSPIFAVLLALLIAQFAYELTLDPKAGLLAGLLTGLSGFYSLIGAHILTDAMGTFFAALTIYAFFEYFFKERRGFAIILGASLALSLIARDENLILIPLLFLLWVVFASKSSIPKKVLYIFLFVALFGIPVLLLGTASTLQGISNILTPIVLNGWPVIIVVSAIVAYVFYKMRGWKIGELFGGFLAFFVIMLPFFYDNYLLGNVLFYVAGKGILSRPISHLIMAQTVGVGAQLSETARAETWIASMPVLLSVPIILASILGLYYMARADRRLFSLLFLWGAVSLGYVIFGTELEDRFLLIAFAPIAILAGIGLAFIWKANPFAGALASAFSFVLADFLPREPMSISQLTLVSGVSAWGQNWLYSFLPNISLSPPRPSLSLFDLVDGIVALMLAVAITLYILKTSVIEPAVSVQVIMEEQGDSREKSSENLEEEQEQKQHQEQEALYAGGEL